jgi:hypothetical protein
MLGRIIGPFFFHDSTIMSAVYLDILHNFLLPQVVGEVDSLIYNKMVHQPIFVPLYALFSANDFLVNGSAGEDKLTGPHGVLT